MYTLKTNSRDKSLKGKQLRRNGIIPAVVFGKHLEESISIQVSQKDAEHLLKTNKVGYKLELNIAGENHMVLLKNVTYDILTRKPEHLEFQALKAGEVITSVAHIVLINTENIDGIVQRVLDEISYKALPSDLIETVEVDLNGKEVGYTTTVADLEITKNSSVEVLTPLESLVVTISAHKKFEESELEVDENTVTTETAE